MRSTKNNTQGMQLHLHYFLPLLSGILLSLALSPVGIGALAWIALVPLFIFLKNITTTQKQAVFGGLITGWIYAIVVLFPLSSLNAWWWTSQGGFLWNNKESIFSLFLLFVALCIGGLFVIIFSLLYRRWSNNTLRDALVIPFIWVSLEYIREWLVLGFTWGEIGYSTHSNLYVAQLASIFGIYGISFLIVSINTLVYLFIKNNLFARKGLFSKPFRIKVHIKDFSLPIALVIIFVAHLWGYIQLSTNNNTLLQTKKVAIIHSNLTTEESIGVQGYNTNLSYLSEALIQKPDIVVTPENIFPFFIIDHDTKLPLYYEDPNRQIGELYDKVRALSSQNTETTLVIGLHTQSEVGRFNSLVVMKDGNIVDIYNKRKLLVFGEKSTRFFRNTHIMPLEAGDSQQSLIIDNAPVTALICSEVIFPILSRQKNSSFIINISNDSIFESSLVGQQNHIMAKFRAIENRTYVARSVKGGTSSIIDPFGRIVTSTSDTKTSGVIFGSIAY